MNAHDQTSIFVDDWQRFNLTAPEDGALPNVISVFTHWSAGAMVLHAHHGAPMDVPPSGDSFRRSPLDRPRRQHRPVRRRGRRDVSAVSGRGQERLVVPSRQGPPSRNLVFQLFGLARATAAFDDVATIGSSNWAMTLRLVDSTWLPYRAVSTNFFDLVASAGTLAVVSPPWPASYPPW